MSTLKEWCDWFGLPEDADALARHLIANANLMHEGDLLTIDIIKAKVREAMGECGTSSLAHHKLREIVPDWRSWGGD